ncbi:hypothetical protein B0J11DRAFT_112533 [Dendryphion nanum]|uniref:Uncharacterized protein n=1 Tax=Dendryphion nanum TaxID=256645 RepID=A0A9P9IDJ9_9PLEO|nr:hypothetical protein B0J11DRAFT_112533 [Dendryphion nanum]
MLSEFGERWATLLVVGASTKVSACCKRSKIDRMIWPMSDCRIRQCRRHVGNCKVLSNDDKCMIVNDGRRGLKWTGRNPSAIIMTKGAVGSCHGRNEWKNRRLIEDVVWCRLAQCRIVSESRRPLCVHSRQSRRESREKRVYVCVCVCVCECVCVSVCGAAKESPRGKKRETPP